MTKIRKVKAIAIKSDIKDKPIVFTGNIKTSSKGKTPEQLFLNILDDYAEQHKVWKDVIPIIGKELIRDIVFWKITGQKKQLIKEYGKPFEVAYEAYKKGIGKKGRLGLASHLKDEKDKKKEADLNKRIDKLIANAKKNPDPKNPYMKFFEGEWIDFSPTALAKRLQDERNKTKLDEGQRVFKDLIAFTNRIAKTNEQLLKPINKLKEPLDKLKSTIPPIPNFNPFAFGGAMKDLPSGGLLSPVPIKGYNKRTNSNTSLLNQRIPFAIPKPKPDGAKRMAVTGTGLTSYMTYHKLKNPVEISKKFLSKDGKVFKGLDGKERKYVAKSFDHLRLICEQMNVNVEEAFLYICEGMNDSKSRWRKHRLDKEYWRGSLSVKNLVSYFDDQVKKSKNNKGSMVYTVKALWVSSYCKNMFEEYGVELPDYTKFTKWFKEMRYHVEMLKKANKK